ncbi:NAD(P)-binding protein [Kribbella qitaiheensis]|uniref:NAD(P)-binding protein n=1 Tax=Kribbella qitaiheensis TaxID=1544730 RepID=A0A7G6X3N9_9ACTN|nr:NAD(P)-binding protein [Kribbella qitaiheensis]
MQVAIIGAGIGGLALAQGLKQAGVEVRLFERARRRASASRGIGSTSARWGRRRWPRCCRRLSGAG